MSIQISTSGNEKWRYHVYSYRDGWTKHNRFPTFSDAKIFCDNVVKYGFCGVQLFDTHKKRVVYMPDRVSHEPEESSGELSALFKFSVVCGGRYGAEVGFARAAKRAGISVEGYARCRGAYVDPDKQTRCVEVYEELGLTESCECKHTTVDMANVRMATTVIVIMRVDSTSSDSPRLLPHTCGRAMRITRSFLRDEYALPSNCQREFSPDDSGHRHVLKDGDEDKHAYCVYISDEDVETHNYDERTIIGINDALFSIPDGGKLLVCGPSEDRVEGVTQYVEEMFNKAFANYAAVARTCSQ